MIVIKKLRLSVRPFLVGLLNDLDKKELLLHSFLSSKSFKKKSKKGKVKYGKNVFPLFGDEFFDSYGGYKESECRKQLSYASGKGGSKYSCSSRGKGKYKLSYPSEFDSDEDVDLEYYDEMYGRCDEKKIYFYPDARNQDECVVFHSLRSFEQHLKDEGIKVRNEDANLLGMREKSHCCVSLADSVLYGEPYLLVDSSYENMLCEYEKQERTKYKWSEK